MKKKFALGVALATAGILGAPAFASAATNCTLTPSTGIVSLQNTGGGAIELDTLGGTLTWFNATGGTGHCIAPSGTLATSENTASVLFAGTPGQADDFIVSEFGGSFL